MAYDFNEVGFRELEEAADSDGRIYWYNVHTGYSTWENPYQSRKTATIDEFGSHDLQNKNMTYLGEQGRERSQSMSTVSDFEHLQASDYAGDELRLSIDADRRNSNSFSSINGRFALRPKSNRPLENSPPENSKSGRLISDVWIECKEVISGRTLFYHRDTKKIMFDAIPTETSANAALVAGTSSENPSGGILPSRLGFRTGASGSGNHQQSSFSSMKLSDFNSGLTENYHMMTPDASSQLNCLEMVKELLGTNSMPWNFNNPVAIYYRCYNKMFATLAELIPSARSLLYPCYYSSAPIPQTKLIVCCVKIPDNTINNGISYTKINVSLSDSADDVITKVLKKCDRKDFEPEKCLLKALGLEEYLYGARNVLDFEYIRNCLSNHVEIRLSLLYIEDMEESIQVLVNELQNDKATKCYPDDIPLTPIYTDQDYEEACSNRFDPVENIRVLPLSQMSIPFKFQICDLENINMCPRFDQFLYAVCIEVKLMFGTDTVPNTTIRTRFRRPREGLLFLQDVILPSIELSTLPLACLLVFSVYGVRLEQKEVLLAYVKQPLIEHNNCLVSGSRCLPMWILPNDDKEFDNLAITRATSRPNLSSFDAPILNVRFPMYLVPIMASPAPCFGDDEYSQAGGSAASNFSSKIRTKLEQIVAKDLLSHLDKEEREILWMARYNYIQNPDVLPKLLRCVDWMSYQQRSEAYYLVTNWAKPRHPLHALCLLDFHYADSYVRSYAVNILDLLSDSELQQVLLQLVQILKFEINHESPLAEFLIRRSIANPYQIGHFLFWHIKAEMHNPEFCERYTLILESYIVHFKKHARELALQNRMIQQLQAIAEDIAFKKIKELTPDSECKTCLQESLARLNEKFPSRLQISLNPKWQVQSLKPASCKYMSSKKVPLWLCFENCDSDAEDLLVIFKTGDDLRQDLLTLQLFRTMDQVWLQEGRDLSLNPYTCVATGVTKNNDGVGMIQVVDKSATISQIQIEEGGGALGAFKNNTLVKWLQKHNRGVNEYAQAANSFLRSCAGYCVATFCLGIGDRHNDNIMLTKDGCLFHIDFGHFLGNFKSKYGFKRERAPFVFTPEMAQVMGGLKSKEYKEFVTLCCSAFNILRKEATLFITLFNLMIAAGMPELSCTEDIYYLRDRLLLSLNDDAASKAFKKEIKKTVSDFYRRVDNSIHILKHG